MNEIEIIPEQENIVVNVEGVKDYNLLTNKPSINNVELTGNKTLQELGIQPTGDYALRSEIPTKLTQLENDGNFVKDANYVHTDNNFTTGEKEKLASLENYDDTGVRQQVEQNKTDIASNKQEITNIKEDYSLITETGNKISLTINSSTYVMTLQLKDKNGSVLSTGTIDLPLETMVVGASYNADTQEIELTLQNGTKVSFSVTDLVSGLVNEDDLNDTLQDYALKTSVPTKLSQLTEDSTHRLVTDTEKATWNNKVDKVDGKGLSTNDFTNELKTKLDGIEDNAQVNKIEKISIDGVEQEINEKEVNIKSYDINKYFYNALTYNELKGNDLTFEDSIEFPLGKLDMDGKSEQITTTGIQLIDKTKAVSNDSSIILLEQITNGIKLTSLIETSGYRYAAIPLDNVDNLLGKKFYFSCKSNNSDKTLIGAKLFWYTTYDTDLIVSIPDLKGNFTIPEVKPEGVTKIRLCLYLSNGATNVPKGTSVEYTDILLKEGTEEAEYEPYTGGQPSPSPDYPQEINSIEGDLEYVGYGSINICPTNIEDWESGQYSNVTGDKVANSARLRVKNLIPCREKTSYYINLKNTSSISFIFIFRGYDKNKKYIKDYGIVGTNKALTFEENIFYISVTIGDSTGSIKYDDFVNAFENNQLFPLICLNSLENKDFVPYKARTLTIPTNGQVFRKVRDVADKLVVDMKTGDYYKEKNIEEFILNGSENWSMSYGTGMFSTRGYYKGELYEAISDKFIYRGVQSGIYNTLKDLQFAIQRYSSRSNLFIKYMKYDNVDSFKEWLKENNATFLCQLETPTLEKIGTLTKEQLDMLVTFKGYNNVMINTNLGQADIDIEYVLDMKKYIDDKIAEISAQMI